MSISIRAKNAWLRRIIDVSQNLAALLRHIEGEPPFTTLDFGCGPGRDLKNDGCANLAVAQSRDRWRARSRPN
jgi:hypothetical protein